MPVAPFENWICCNKSIRLPLRESVALIPTRKLPKASNVAMSRPNSRRLTVESLESRNLMAGNVTADVVAGSLILQGDGQSNGVVIMPVFAAGRVQPGAFMVRGAEWEGPTTINGQSQFLFRFVNDDIEIRMAGGQDLVILGGNGNRIGITDDLIIDTGDGGDAVWVSDVDVGGRVQVNTGSGRDEVNLIDLTVRELSSYIELVVSTGNDADRFYGDSLSVTGKMLVDTGLDAQTDTVQLVRSGIVRDVWITTGSGNDTVELDTFVCDDLQINSGDGQDQVALDNVSVDLLFADLGNGDQDYLRIARSNGSRATVNGGNGGGDRFDFYDDVNFTSVLEAGFEVIVT